MELLTLVKCDSLPQDKSEIPASDMARSYPHLEKTDNEIPTLDEAAGIRLLIGRDTLELLKVRAFKNGTNGPPGAITSTYAGQLLAKCASTWLVDDSHENPSMKIVDSWNKWRATPTRMKLALGKCLFRSAKQTQ